MPLRIEDSSENGLVGYWKFDEGTNTGAILDSSGYGNTGTRRGGAGKIWSGSSLPSLQFENRYAMQFDGVDDYVIGGPNGTAFSALTISTWVSEMPLERREVFCSGHIHSVQRPQPYLRDAVGTLTWYINGDYIWPVARLSDDTWTHLVTTWDGSTWKSYKNGILSLVTAEVMDSRAMRFLCMQGRAITAIGQASSMTSASTTALSPQTKSPILHEDGTPQGILRPRHSRSAVISPLRHSLSIPAIFPQATEHSRSRMHCSSCVAAAT